MNIIFDLTSTFYQLRVLMEITKIQFTKIFRLNHANYRKFEKLFIQNLRKAHSLFNYVGRRSPGILYRMT
ncbi:hypothetical protein BpHYR1_010812 [Brachionus plicatilis]|uniref:Uncharacterized protein n=1 Tax=Brachionus plicatilis TaxID=10195 RepID=A0A3M7QGW3_BRAPC|nr:hypothetical protein BpHYR1_010812 [Brachionus plicatilis]